MRQPETKGLVPVQNEGSSTSFSLPGYKSLSGPQLHRKKGREIKGAAGRCTIFGANAEKENGCVSRFRHFVSLAKTPHFFNIFE